MNLNIIRHLAKEKGFVVTTYFPYFSHPLEIRAEVLNEIVQGNLSYFWNIGSFFFVMKTMGRNLGGFHLLFQKYGKFLNVLLDKSQFHQA